jgi:quinol monooxygenase YgiN
VARRAETAVGFWSVQCPRRPRANRRSQPLSYQRCRQLALGTDSVVGVLGTLLRFELKDDAAVRGFDALAEKLVVAVRAAEPETLVYVFHSVEDAPLSRVVYEVYANQEAVAQHQSAEYFQRAMVELDQYVVSARMEVLGAPNGKLLADVSGTT